MPLRATIIVPASLLALAFPQAAELAGNDADAPTVTHEQEADLDQAEETP